MNNQLIPFDQQLTLADAIAKSGMFGIKTRDQAIVLMALCESEGLHPVKACQDYHIINGRPALKSDAMLVRFHQAGGKVEWKQYTDESVSAVFSHPQGGTIDITWTFEQARKAGLTNKDTWKAYPRAMLRARVISEGVRTVWPGANAGMYTVEEVQDFTDSPEKAPKVVAQQFIAPIPSRVGLDSVYASTLDDNIAMLNIDKSRLLAWAQKKYKVANFADLTFDQCSDLISRLPKFAEKQVAPSEAERNEIEKDIAAFNPEITADDFLQFAADAKEAAEHCDDPKTRKEELKRAAGYEKKARDMLK